MGQASTTAQSASTRGRIAWRRAADELLIAAIFSTAEDDERDAPAADARAPRPISVDQRRSTHQPSGAA